MSESDGAHAGVDAERAIETIIGGKEQPTESEKRTPEQMIEAIRAATLEPEGYGAASLAIARIIWEAFEKYPTLKEHPMEGVYLLDSEKQIVESPPGSYKPVILVEGLFVILKKLHPDEESIERKCLSGITGFMWGWAVNAVGYALGKPPVANPALMTIEGDES